MAKKPQKTVTPQDLSRLWTQFQRRPLQTIAMIVFALIASFFGGKTIIEKSDKGDSRDVQTFAKAKTKLIKLYKDNPNIKEFYCGCDFTYEERKSSLDFKKCGYQVRNQSNIARANRIEWEHVMPAHNFGKNLQCWQEGGRKNCQDYAKFNVMEGDMHNLQPAIGEVNGDRSNFRYSEFTKRFGQYGKCHFAVDPKKRQVQPRNEIKGVIARTYLYMEARYGIKVAEQEKKLMNEWNRTYPVNAWECRRNEIIAKMQGNDNPFITSQCKK
ncbi:endonuclease [Wohlfahrtiimonas chitiniclastica]|uniref:endonuclease n=1 Tax=Wohlfahrtiimonas chitiniclastica TaxID=400946 RepID=UPI001BCC3D91|nr:endonuclease [Wohlfahrtiimonas chitiniclastica]MBS7816628.1 endonuclease [Wohlfahrtiimonas chitiniclastica]MBS7822455.1 endonuclease [Wohlfahrtiimonas chitiniclastica]MBS7830018.1 endonuclease [Wohlfahrtiimonas chitiniclastica]MBS7832190.1 endonuclease [Wohlfahrtiimonas chitiniclastica]